MKKILLAALLFFVGVTQAQMSGTYTVGAGGNYDSLATVIRDLNTNGINGPVTILLLNGTQNVAVNVALGCAGTSATNTITIKPDAGATVVVNFLDGTTAANIDGHFVIGSPTAASTNLVSTNYVTIDGSNNGTNSKDLTFNGPVTTFQRSVFRIYGNNDNITIKNCVIIDQSSSSSTTAPINVTAFNASSVNYVPDNLTIQNNTLTAVAGNGGIGVTCSNSGTVTVGMTKLVVRDNIIAHRGTRGVMCNYVSDADIFGNSISANMQLGSGAGAGIWLSTGTSAAGTFNIYNNKFSSLVFLNNTAGASNGYIAIDNQFATPKVVNIYNNFITGFAPTSGVANSRIYGIRQTGSSTTNVYHNTIVMPDMTNMTVVGGSTLIAGIAFATAAVPEISPTGTMVVKNNIIVSNEGDMKNFAIRRVGTNGTFTSDYNDISVAATDSAFVGFNNATAAKAFADWQAATAGDANSKNVGVNFVSATDLHLTGASTSEVNLLGVAGLGITTDIDGTVRNTLHPFMGAHEADPALPVELTAFTASARGTSVVLTWSTATEKNNFGFDVEKCVNGAWSKIGFVPGAGTSASPKSYQYVDASVSGSVSYRLKQIDRDGAFTYSAVVEAAGNAVAQGYELAQNYPNPFNPSTTIRFAVKQTERATVKVYDVAGREVAELFNDVAEAGRMYSVPFNASGLSSGMYFYVLQSQSVREVKRMQLLK